MDYILKAKLACLSTDEKPTSIPGYTDDLKPSVLWELDTNKKYYYTEEGWVEVGSGNKYTLLNKQITPTYDGETSYYVFELQESDFDADAFAVISDALSGGTPPPLTVTCAVLNIQEEIVPHSTNYSWQSDNIGIWIDTDQNLYGVAILHENIGELANVTITISFSGA